MYETNDRQFETRHDCLYTYAPSQLQNMIDGGEQARSLVPYCRRSDKPISEISASICQAGTPITFSELRRNNITAFDLYAWQAPIDLIDQYAAHQEDGVFCNCSNLEQFGLHCEYEFPLDSNQDQLHPSFTQIIEDQFNAKMVFSDSRELFDNITCYMGLSQCKSHLCLDWRQVCNGIIECAGGEDEKECAQMELHVCPDSVDEYRCRSGQCIPRAFTFDRVFDCLDRSDEQIDAAHTFKPSCYKTASIECEEFKCGWLTFSCGDGFCLFERSWGHRNCENGRDFAYLQQLFHDERRSFCMELLMCHIGLGSYVRTACFILCGSFIDCQPLILSTCTNDTSWIQLPSRSIISIANVFLFIEVNRSRGTVSKVPERICLITDNHTMSCKQNELDYSSLPDWNDFIRSLHMEFAFAARLNTIEEQQNKSSLQFLCSESGHWISAYRINDGKYDCPFSEIDEAPATSCQRPNDIDLLRCSGKRRCWPRGRFLNGIADCADSSDEPFRIRMSNVYIPPFISVYIRHADLSAYKPFHFQDLCDDIAWRKISTDDDSETDETDCFEWPCDTRAKRCNGFWNCPDGRDELNCPQLTATKIARTFLSCAADEHICINLTTRTSGCLSMNRAGDGKVDCMGATDERTGHCRLRYPYSPDESGETGKYRFRCGSDSLECVPIDRLCDGVIDCFKTGDDEHICPWIHNSTCVKQNGFLCADGDCLFTGRCNGIIECLQYGEDEWFCDMVEKRLDFKAFSFHDFQSYPLATVSHAPVLSSVIPTSLKRHRSVRTAYSLPYIPDFPTWYCHRGIYVVVKTNQGGECLCPPSYYGDHCQFQSNRLTLFLQVQTRVSFASQSLLRLFCFLLDSNETILDFEYITHSPQNQSTEKHILYLVGAHASFVRVDAYEVTTVKVATRASWLFPIHFPFLPVNRVAQVLLVSDEHNKCETNCGLHGSCRHYVNNPRKDYCLCDQGWIGDICEIKVNCTCIQNALCVQGRRCVCPVGRMGATCHATYDPCKNVDCHHNGTCLPVDERSLKAICICTTEYFGDSCQFTTAQIVIGSALPSHLSIEAVILHFLTVTDHGRDHTTDFLVPISRILLAHGLDRMSVHIRLAKQSYVPAVAYAQLFTDVHNFYGSYYLIIFLTNQRQVVQLETKIESVNRCPHIEELFDENRTILTYSHLKRSKFYYNLCVRHPHLNCLHDEFYMCFCDQRRQLDCLMFNHDINNCSTNVAICLNEGRCLQTNSDNIWDFACVCPRCFYGPLCQFTTLHYIISLDALLASQMLMDESLSSQPIIINIIIWIVIIMSVVALVGNTLSVRVFVQPTTRQVSCGLYLLIASIIAEMTMIVFGARFTYLLSRTHVFAYVGNCLLLESLLILLPKIFDWLTACVAVDRAMIVMHGMCYNKSKNRRIARYVIIVLFLMLIIGSIHEPLHREVIEDPRASSRQVWCILNFSSHRWLQRYESISNIIHLIGPFIVNILSTVSFLMCQTRRKLAQTINQGRKSYRAIIRKEIMAHKPFVISPILLTLFSLPRLIFTFAFACIEYDWQRNMYLAGYIVSFVPLASVIFIFVLPSPSYRKELIVIYYRVLKICKKTS